jgi:DNA polymerase I-like protein with 3'-5' exonuclease and polymerase domains
LEELYTFQLEQWKISRDLTLRGVNFNTTLQKEMRLQLLEEASSHAQWLLNVVPAFSQFTSTGKPWYDSPKGTATLFYTTLGLSPVLHKKTKQPTTDDAALQELGDREPWLSPLIERLRHLRSLGVFTSNFLDAKVSADGRMHPSFNIAHPETFRWSSNKNAFGEGLNGQNIPKGDKDAGFFESASESGFQNEAGSEDGEEI